jgi:hypothetical protein
VVKIHYGEGIANRIDGYFFLKIRIYARFKILSVWIACSAMNASSIKLHRKSARAAERVRTRVARAGGMRPRGAGNVRDRWPTPKIFGEWTFAVWRPRKPLKSHETAKTFFGNVWRKQAEIWKSLPKKLGGSPLFRRLCVRRIRAPRLKPSAWPAALAYPRRSCLSPARPSSPPPSAWPPRAPSRAFARAWPACPRAPRSVRSRPAG